MPEKAAAPSKAEPKPSGETPQSATEPSAAPSDAGHPAAAQPSEAAPSGEAAAPASEGEAGAKPEETNAGGAETEKAPAALPGPPANAVPSPSEMENMLSQQLAQSPQPNSDWTAPAPIFTLHGYYRVRGELMDTLWLGREQNDVHNLKTGNTAYAKDQGTDPFSRFRPLERRELATSAKGPSDLNCVSDSTKSDATCDVSTLRFANMRLRLAPQLNVSEDVRVKMMFDVFDNYVLGEPPATYYGTSLGANTVFPGMINPADNATFGNSIKARRVWAEVRNRDLGELRFGRMPMSWGLGMYYNAGDRLDDDVSTDMDRVMWISPKLLGLYASASMDFTGEGVLDSTGSYDRPIDQSQLDDTRQFTFSIARRNTPEELAAMKERGDVVLNGGVQLSLRSQDSLYNPWPATGTTAASAPPSDATSNMTNSNSTNLTTMLEATNMMSNLERLNSTVRTTDAWGQFKLRNLRIEAEFAWVNGGMDRVTPRTTATMQQTTTGPSSYTINQLGYVIQAELRLLNEKLGIYFEHGLATGDGDVDGLDSGTDFVTQHDNNRTISTFRFHPSYHVDLILWRNIMQQVTGAMYFRPSVSYDFIRSAFGQLAGARLDFIYSRATSMLQTWGNDPNLGFEIDASVYFRSEDGPELDDGFHAMVQYGVLFPMRGLGFLHEDTNLSTAQTLRLILGVVF